MEHMDNTLTINGNIAEQTHQLQMDYTWGSVPIGNFNNRMEFFPETAETKPYMLWHVCPAGEDIDTSYKTDEWVIGLRITSERQVLDYDGVFSLPNMAIALLESLGFDCTEVKDED